MEQSLRRGEDEVAAFGELMIHVLESKAHKPHWGEMTEMQAFAGLCEEAKEVAVAYASLVNARRIYEENDEPERLHLIEEIVQMCVSGMILVDNLGGLYGNTINSTS